MTRQQEDASTGSVHCHGPVFRWQESVLSDHTPSAEPPMILPLGCLYKSADALSLDLGSGGTNQLIVFVAHVGPSSTSTTSDSPRKSQASESAPAMKPSVAQMLIDIRSSFGIGVSQLAKFLQVERPTVYAWLQSRNNPRFDNRRRIETIWDIAREWASNGLPAFAAALDQVVAGGTTIREQLQQEHLRTFVINRAIGSLAPTATPDIAAGRKGRLLAESFGRSESSSAADQFEAITGRPFAEDQ